ncbi:glycosyltransferase family 2 protein [Niveispirillum cyanobacteriorum]|uniref:Glycosyl transferase n=1 Tax=Niveispirillum cyanobacteriorum TaxID=1612173 RepID=A0A2K9NAX9_9PROT|nr:glycosyltransferase family 2 protein [Niveispirillum cyanobacteriorum]AUN30239.1 glycosyl transferase [Niveispirillum cyanobacteriorum]GGE56515.1 glycosyl transferase [Niveispirillum cyanobacteriorum]
MSDSLTQGAPSIAVLVPCYNEEASIEAVVRDFKAALPTATIYVYDNNSKDRTSEIARAAGAVVRREPLQGKGNVVRRMFADIEADVYVMVDGDDTYHAPSAGKLVAKLLDEKLDMVNGARVTDWENYRAGHRLGNVMLTTLVTMVFGKRTDDLLSGYRVFSRRFVKSFPVLAGGFEIETELVVHALEMSMPLGEVETPYKDRAPGSVSKLSTFRDGFRILWMIGKLIKEERPMQSFGLIAVLLALISIIIAAPLFITYFETGLVPRFPTAVLATGLGLLSFLSLTCGLILDTVTRGRREMKRLRYLEIPAPDFDSGFLK